MIQDRPVSALEVITEMSTPRGASFLLWRLLREQDKDVTLEEVRGAIPLDDTSTYNGMLKVLGIVDGEDTPEKKQERP